jgi:hypothetical protein
MLGVVPKPIPSSFKNVSDQWLGCALLFESRSPDDELPETTPLRSLEIVFIYEIPWKEVTSW